MSSQTFSTRAALQSSPASPASTSKCPPPEATAQAPWLIGVTAQDYAAMKHEARLEILGATYHGERKDLVAAGPEPPDSIEEMPRSPILLGGHGPSFYGYVPMYDVSLGKLRLRDYESAVGDKRKRDPNKPKRKKPKRDPNKPKRAASAYMLWCNDNRDRIKVEGGDGVKYTEIMQV
jgi:hypothetical protein